MKKMKPEKISTIVLWCCMIITLGIFIRFYFGYIQNPDLSDIPGTAGILNWSLIILAISISALLIFSVYYFLKSGTEKTKKRLQPLIWLVLLALLLFISYIAGSGQPLVILGYAGNENTFPWLKLADMWLYSVYVLSGLCIAALFFGIIWSYLKKR